MIEYRLLDDVFFEPYRLQAFPAHMTELGRFVYYRTYSRWLPDEQRRETWAETVRRAVEYNCSLAPTPADEAKRLFDNVFNLRQFLSGRTFWVGGTQIVQRSSIANFNCAFIVLDSLAAFEELFYLLMVGTGVGFRVLPKDVEKLPQFRTNVEMRVAEYTGVPRGSRQERSSIATDGVNATITVGDSKEGWVDALRIYLAVLTHFAWTSVTTLTIDFSHVRPKGERLLTFGGTASGHDSLQTMFAKIHGVIAKTSGRLAPIDALDIANIIGENVVVGGVRRTAEIGLGGADDEAFWLAKKNLTPETYHRFMSNNSVFYEDKPDLDTLHRQFETLRDEGEPCFVNAEAARKRRPRFEGVNPCVEILLDNRGLCNLTTVNVSAFVDHDGQLDLDGLLEAQRLSARAGYRMTCVTLELPMWDIVQKRDRLTGCSLTGWQDAMERWTEGDDQSTQGYLLQGLRDMARHAADEYADSLGTPRSLLVTAVKPEGTLSQVAGGVSNGLHVAHSPYYIRRIRISASDPLAKVAMSLDWPVSPEVGQTWADAKTLVIEFPVASGANRTKYDVTALDQLETYRMFNDCYSEHNSSNTITVKDDEWNDVERWVDENWNDMVAVSFLKLDGHVYDLAPYEAITKEEYDRRRASMQPFDAELLRRFERGEDFDIGDDACDSGVCPVR